MPLQRAPAIAERLAAWQDGVVKLLVTAAGLRLRRERPDLFLTGEYCRWSREVTVGASLVAFARMHGDRGRIFVAPRFTRLADRRSSIRMPIGGERWKTSRVLLPAAS